MNWSEERVERLRTLWREGLSTAQIGRELGVTKNSVVGKVHRMKDMKPRPSPIVGKMKGRTAGRARPARPQRIGDPVELGPQMCRWPFGDPGDADFHFCGKQVAPGKPYCQPHCELAYVVRSR